MKLFVWDLHGTLEQGNERASIDISNQILERFGYSERLADTAAQELYGLRWYQYFEHLLPREPHERHLELQAASFALSNSPAGDQIIAGYMQPAPYALDTLSAIHQSPHHQLLISHTTPTSLRYYTKALGLDEYFTVADAIAIDSHTRGAQHSKAAALLAYRGQQPFEQVIVIGDSNSDMDLAETTGATSYLYAHPGQPFRSTRGHHQIHDLRRVLQELGDVSLDPPRTEPI